VTDRKDLPQLLSAFSFFVPFVFFVVKKNLGVIRSKGSAVL